LEAVVKTSQVIEVHQRRKTARGPREEAAS
jgi:hypothetical protein